MVSAGCLAHVTIIKLIIIIIIINRQASVHSTMWVLAHTRPNYSSQCEVQFSCLVGKNSQCIVSPLLSKVSEEHSCRVKLVASKVIE